MEHRRLTLTEWATRWGVSSQALAELAAAPAFVPDPPRKPVESESGLQALVRLEAGRKGIHLWRNNSGAGYMVDRDRLCSECRDHVRSRLVRWGLANESPALNEILKSADLIGWRPRLIVDGMVGHTIAQFVSRECKKPGWHYTGTPEEVAQNRWHSLVLAAGGDSAIVNTEGSL